MTKKNKKTGLCSRAAAFGPSTLNRETRTVDFTLSTGNPVRVFDWDSWRVINEVLIPEGMELPAGRNQVPLLDTHDSSTIQNVLGSVRNIRVEGNEIAGTNHFMTDDLSQKAFEAVEGGHLTDGSVGYLVKDYRNLKPGEEFEFNGRTFNGDIVQRVVTKWRLKEFSLAPIGADEGAKARSENLTEESNVKKNETVETPVNQEPTQERAAPITPVIDTAKIEKEAAERASQETMQRMNQIRTECRSLGLTDEDTDAVLAIADIAEARKAMIERRASMTTPIKQGNIEVTAHEDDKFRKASTDGLLMRAGLTVANPAPGAESIQFGFKGLARECLERKGVSTRGMSDEEILKRASLGYQGTSDFANITLDAANKAILMGWQAIPSTYEQFCKIGSVSDFKTHNRVRLSDAPEMTKLNDENADLERKSFSDAKAYLSADTYGLVWGISRKAMINDDLGILNDIPMAIGARARQQVNAFAYSLLSSNLLYDGSSAIFSAGNKNLATVAEEPNATSLSAMRVAMMSQTDINGTKLNMQPAFIICGPENADNLYIILNSEKLPDSQNGANPFRNMAQPIVDANITGKEWYGIVNPMFPTIEIVFLNGQRVPQIEQLPINESLGMSFRSYLDWGGAVLDYRGIYKNAGE